jgi:hypothetical protein
LQRYEEKVKFANKTVRKNQNGSFTRLVIGFCLEDWGRLYIFAPSINKIRYVYEKESHNISTNVHDGIEQ